MKLPLISSLMLFLAAGSLGSRVAWAQSAPQVLLVTGFAEVTGRDILGTEFPLGSGEFSLQLTVPSPFRTAPDSAGQQTWSSAFSDFSLDAPSAGFPRGGGTIQNTLTAAREGEPNADFISFGVSDCDNGNCNIPISSLPNSEALGFEGMFGNVLLPDGALGTEPFDSLGAFIQALAALDLTTAPQSLLNATYVPESLLSPSGSAAGDGGLDIRFVSVDGTISDISIVPEPAGIVVLLVGGGSIFVRRRCG